MSTVGIYDKTKKNIGNLGKKAKWNRKKQQQTTLGGVQVSKKGNVRTQEDWR